MPARLLPLPLGLVLGAIYLFGGLEPNGTDLVGWNEMVLGIQDGLIAAMSDDTVIEVHDFIMEGVETYRVPIEKLLD